MAAIVQLFGDKWYPFDKHHLWLTALFINRWRLRQNGCKFPDAIFKCILLNVNIWISIKISLTFVPKGEINNIPALVQIMAWRRSGDKPLSEAMLVSLPTYICVTRTQWVKSKLAHVILVTFKQTWNNSYADFTRRLLPGSFFWLFSNHQNWFLYDFVKKWHFFLNFISYHIFAIYVGCRPLAGLQLVGFVCHRSTVWS